MESRLEEVTRRLKETEKSLANIYQMEQQDINGKAFGFDNLMCPWNKTSSYHCFERKTEINNSSKLFPTAEVNHVESGQSTPLESVERNFNVNDLVSSTPKKYKHHIDEMYGNKILHEKVIDLQAELKIQDQSLREAEERFERAQQDAADVTLEKEHFQKVVQDLTIQLNQIKHLKKMEKEDLKRHFEEYQKNSQEKCRLLENKMLTVCKERDDLIQSVCSLQSNLSKHISQIRKIQDKNAQMLQEKYCLKDENGLLKSELESTKHSVSVIELTTCELQNIQQENCHLQCKLELQAQQINDNTTEKEKVKEALLQFLHLFDDSLPQDDMQSSRNTWKTEANDSGNMSWKTDNKHHISKIVSEFETLLQISVPTACNSLLSDIQSKIADQGDLIKRLQAIIQSMEDTQKKDLEKESIEAADNYHKNKRKLAELTDSNEYLTQQLNQLKGSFQALKYQLAESEAKTEKLDFSLNQRNAQLVELQEEMNQKCYEVCQLERNLRNRSYEVTRLEQQLDEKITEFSEQFTKYQGFEEELKVCESQLDQTRKECKDLKEKQETIRKDKENNVEFHITKLQDQEKLIDKMQRKSVAQQEVILDLSKQIERSSQELCCKSATLKDLQSKEKETLQKLAQKNEELDNVQLQLDFQTSESKNRVKQMEMSIESLKAEISCHIQKMQESKNQYIAQLAQNNAKERSLLGQLKLLEQTLKDKKQECVSVQQTLEEGEVMLEQSYKHISQLEDSQINAQKEMSKLEQHLLTERSKQMELVQSLKHKSDQLQRITQERQAEIKLQNDAIQELQATKTILTQQIHCSYSQLQQEQKKGLQKTASLSYLKEKYKQNDGQLQQRINTVSKLEHQVKVQEEQLTSSSKENRDLHQVVAALQAKIDDQRALDEENKHKLENVEYNMKAKDDILEDTKDTIKKLQVELCLKKDEIENLKQTNDQQHLELDNRASKVSELASTMSEYQKEMEDRIENLESQLEQRELNVRNKTEQISQYKDQHQRTVAELQSKSSLLEQTEQICHKLQLELTAKKASVQHSAKIAQSQKEREKELQENKAEVTQELRLTRERLQSQTNDFLLARHQLSLMRQHNDELIQTVENLSATLNTKGTETTQLVEDVNILRLEKVQIETKMSAEVKQLQQEIKMGKQTHCMELERLKENLTLLQSSRDEITARLNETSQQKLKNSAKHEQDMNSIKASLHLLQDELKVQKETVVALNENIVIKDVELTKLKADLSNSEKKLLGLKILQLRQNSVSQQQHLSSVSDTNKHQAENNSTLKTENQYMGNMDLRQLLCGNDINIQTPLKVSLMPNSLEKHEAFQNESDLSALSVPYALENLLSHQPSDIPGSALQKITEILAGMTVELPSKIDSMTCLKILSPSPAVDYLSNPGCSSSQNKDSIHLLNSIQHQTAQSKCVDKDHSAAAMIDNRKEVAEQLKTQQTNSEEPGDHVDRKV